MLPMSITLRDLWAWDLWSFLRQAYFVPKPTWGTDQIPDLSGKVIIVTGGNAGIGKATVKALLEHNAKVYIACRDEKKAEAAIEELHSSTGKHALFLKIDLSDLKTVKAGAEEFINKEKELHILFNNAGIMMAPFDQLANGYDLQFHTNVLGHFYLTKLLLPVLLAGTKSSPGGKVRVVNTTSSGHYFAKAQLDFNTFKDGPARSKLTTELMYFQSKYGNIVFANELARRYRDQGIVSTSVNPGNIQTELNRHVINNARSMFGLRLLQFYKADTGALTQLWAGTSPEGVDLGGKYLMPWAKVGRARSDAEDPQLGRELWTWLEEQVDGI